MADGLRPGVDWGEYRTLALERRDDGILVIAAIDSADPAVMARRHTEIAGIWSDFADDPDLRVAVFIGCDDSFPDVGDATEAYLVRESLAAVNGIINCDKPIVSAINGTAVGTELAIALLADVSVASTEARLVDAHLLQGTAVGGCALLSWPLLCGMAKAKLYLLASEELTGAEAERIGLVSLAVPPSEVLDIALLMASRMAAAPQHALRSTKRSLNHWLRTAATPFGESLDVDELARFGSDAVPAGHPAADLGGVSP